MGRQTAMEQEGLAVILGTRPEIIKMAPVVRAARAQGIRCRVIHTGQHYSHDMDGVFFEQLGLEAPDVNLGVGSASHGAQMGRMLERIEAALSEMGRPRVLTHGDTNTTATGALIATRHGLWTGHVEAGLRSNDRTMPEEHNRIVADHVCDALYAPTESAARNLVREGLSESRIHVTGNTIVDAVEQHLGLARARPWPLEDVEPGQYILMTAHRQENVDVPTRFAGILEGARRVSRETGLPVVYSIHPRSRRRLLEQDQDASGLRLVDPVGYLDFLRLMADASLVLTDSGGLQEEACILQVPCVTLRDNTERPETLEVGANVLAGTDAERIGSAGVSMVSAARTWTNPFGDGKAGERIVNLHMEGASSPEPEQDTRSPDVPARLARAH